MLKHASLFSGFGGFDLAAEWMGWENVFHCEWNEFLQRILNYYWKNAISYGDITRTNFIIHRGTIDVLTGGFPCQPFSLAGKRKGTEDERHLWPQMLRAIREIQPTYVVGENVYGIVNWDGGLVFDEVQTQLEAQGFEIIPVILPACAVNAPHRRDRVWFVAYSKNNGRRRRKNIERQMRERKLLPGEQKGSSLGNKTEGCGGKRIIADTSFNDGRNLCGQKTIERNEQSKINEFSNNSSSFTDTNTTPTEYSIQTGRNIATGLCQSDITNTTSKQSKRVETNQQPKTGEQKQGELGRGTGENDVTNTKCKGGIEILQNIQSQQPNGQSIDSFNERTDWSRFPTQPPICGGDDGLPSELDGVTFSHWREESIKGFGNAVVPQEVFEIFKCIQAHWESV